MPKKNLPKDFVYSEMLRWCIMLTATIFWYSDKNYVYLVQKFSVEKKNIGKMSPSYLTSVTLHRPSHTHQSEFAYLHWRGLNPTLSGPRKRAPYLATTEGPSRRCVLENSRVGDISRTEIKYSCAKKVLTIFFFGGGGESEDKDKPQSFQYGVPQKACRKQGKGNYYWGYIRYALPYRFQFRLKLPILAHANLTYPRPT